jgi:hypothetical protein
MSGRRIDDHSNWAGAPGKHSVFPDGPHKVKMESSAEGAGHLGSLYPDTTEQIKSVQEMGDRKAKGHPMKTGYRY